MWPQAGSILGEDLTFSLEAINHSFIHGWSGRWFSHGQRPSMCSFGGAMSAPPHARPGRTFFLAVAEHGWFDDDDMAERNESKDKGIRSGACGNDAIRSAVHSYLPLKPIQQPLHSPGCSLLTCPCPSTTLELKGFGVQEQSHLPLPVLPLACRNIYNQNRCRCRCMTPHNTWRPCPVY